MIWKRSILALASATLLASTFAAIEEDEGVLVLTDANFDEAVAQHDPLLVEFYAPWCGHCKKLAPEYVNAAAALQEQDPPLRIAKVDATENKEVAKRFGIQGFPTLKFFRGNTDSIKEYDGGRTASEIQSWVIKKSGPAVHIISDKSELDKLKEDNDVVVFAHLDSEDGEKRAILEKIADNDAVSIFAASTKSGVSEDATSAGSIVLYKKFDEGKNVYDGKFESSEITPFVMANRVPLVVGFTQEKASTIFGGDIHEHALIFVDPEADYNDKLVEAVKGPAKANKGKLSHVTVPPTESRLLDFFGLKEEDMPYVMLVNMAVGVKKYSFDYNAKDLVSKIESGFADDLISFEERYFKGEVTPTLKSAEPEDDSDEAVKVIVGKQFKERVVNNKKDVLLEFYAPWCGHCKSLAPKYEELAENFADDENIVVAKMDATANEVDHPGVDVQGFPTIIFFPANDKMNPVQYSGERDVEPLTDFLKKNTQAAKVTETAKNTDDVEHEEL